ncbi:MAG TPA: murein biosynthesis integral membrane protein MurJ [Bryobacteraceae bacterium]|nr:murein biosynthesis integral membrane protein MurJ [Bryobacteraceae bacterium]
MQVRIRISRHPKLSSKPAENSKLDPIPTSKARSVGASSLVALGILISRLTGLLRERVTAHYLGSQSIVADAFRAAIRIPNLLNNLFGEGVLSASFITVYSKLRATHDDEEAEDLAAAIFGILLLICAALVLAGIVLTPYLIAVIAPGFAGERRNLTIRLVRVVFPGTGLLVMSAWCLGILNSHRRFLLSYMAPVAMNCTMIVALILLGAQVGQSQLVVYLVWAYVVGSALQFLVQLPKVLQLLPHFRPLLDIHSPSVRAVMRNFGPVFVSRGVVQVSAFIDSMIASWLPLGAVASLGYGQIISVLPISLFSMSVSAAELPALSSAVGSREEVAAFLRNRLSAGLRRIAFLIVPSAVAFLILGDVVVAALYQTGRFSHADVAYVWAVLAGSSVGLLATSLGRLYSSAFYALFDTRTPLRFAVIRVVLTTILGYIFALPLPRWLGIHQEWGVAGLTASAGIAGWVEFALLRRGLRDKIGATPLPPDFLLRLWSMAIVSATLGYSVKRLIGTNYPLLTAAVVLPIYGLAYFAGTSYWGIEESRAAISPILRRIRR